MSDKKIIIIALVLAIGLAFGGWLLSGKDQEPLPDNTAAGVVLGSESAPITIEEYTNFTCPACKAFAQETLPKIEDKYVKTGKVKFVFNVIGYLEFGQASFCADKAGKFAEFHDHMFGLANITAQENVIFEAAKKVGIDEQNFRQCYGSNEAKKTAQGWAQKTKKNKIEYTPTFFINGQKIVGNKPISEFEKAIEEALKN